MTAALIDQAGIDPAADVLDRFGHSVENGYAVLSEKSGVPLTTVWHRDHGRPSMKQKAANQQYLTPHIV